MGFPRSSAACAGSFLSEPLQPRQKIGSISTTTASGVFCWLSNDPIGIAGGLNQYAFCRNNPVNFIDPLGLDSYDTLMNVLSVTPIYGTLVNIVVAPQGYYACDYKAQFDYQCAIDDPQRAVDKLQQQIASQWVDYTVSYWFLYTPHLFVDAFAALATGGGGAKVLGWDAFIDGGVSIYKSVRMYQAAQQAVSNSCPLKYQKYIH